MGHGTQINGVHRDITGGTNLVNGIQRNITKGLTLTNGVQRDISFSPKMYAVTLDGTGWNASACYITIDGVKYNAAQYTEVPEGTLIYCQVYANPSVAGSAITLNGKAIGTAGNTISGGTWRIVTYSHTVMENATITASQSDDFMYFSMAIKTGILQGG